MKKYWLIAAVVSVMGGLPMATAQQYQPGYEQSQFNQRQYAGPQYPGPQYPGPQYAAGRSTPSGYGQADAGREEFQPPRYNQRPESRMVNYQSQGAMELEPELSATTSQRVSQQLRTAYRQNPPTQGLDEGPGMIAPDALTPGMPSQQAPPYSMELNQGPMVPQPQYGMHQGPQGPQGMYGSNDCGCNNGPVMGGYDHQPGYNQGCSSCGSSAGCGCGDDFYQNGHPIRNRGRMVRSGCDTGYGCDSGMGLHGRYLGRSSDQFIDQGCGDYYDSSGAGSASCGPRALGGGSLGLLGNQCDTYTVFGAGWLLLKRDGADFQPLSYETGMPGNQLSVSDANIPAQHGFEVFMARQNNQGRGWEIRYWGVGEDDNFATLGNMPLTEYGGFNTITVGAWGDAWTLWNTADTHQIARESDLHNIEFNFLRYASSCGPCRNIVFRGAAGLRVIRFNDSLAYSAYSSSYFGGTTFDSLKLHSTVANTIVAAQAGGSGEYCLSNRLRLSLGSKVGIGGNSVDMDQCLVTANGIYGRNSLGNDYSFMSSTSDISLFGEFNTNLYYHISDSCRISVGYRFFGISGVALSQDQLPYDYTDVNEINAINRDGSLLMHGLTLGAEFCH